MSARLSLSLLVVAADALAASPARLVNPLQPGPFAAADETIETFVAMPGAGKLPSEWEQLWRRGAAAHEDFMREFDAAGGAVTDAAWAALESAAESLEELGQYKLDPVRASMLFGKLVEVYASLSRDDGKCLRAAHWCVQQACTQACVDAYAVDEASPRDAFNAAISSAVTYYRRGGDLARAEAARALANKHPAASTKYERVRFQSIARCLLRAARHRRDAFFSRAGRPNAESLFPGPPRPALLGAAFVRGREKA